MKRSGVSRRQFFKSAALAGAAVAAPSIVPASTLGRAGAAAPSERIRVGAIGVGGRGMHNLHWCMDQTDTQVLAMCDIRKERREVVKDVVDAYYGNNDFETYRDMFDMFEQRPDLDVILIATGDRWHALAAIYAMRAGYDVFSEKPSSMTIAEGRAVVDTARRHGRVYQTCTQRLSERNHVFAIELARSGRLGRIHTTYAHIAPWDDAYMTHDWKPAQPKPADEEVDWDAWLGPCPWRPYNGDYVRGRWRGVYDFHTSCIGEWGAHTFAQAMAGIDCLDTAPVKYSFVDNDTGDGMECEFANGIKLVLSRGDKYWHGSCGERFDGEDGWVAAADGYRRPEASSPELVEDFDGVIEAYKARTQRSINHMRDFLDCVRTRNKPVANESVMHYSMVTVHAANICMWLKRDLRYDPVKEEFINDDEANRLRSRAMRAPYVI